jgi:phage I-like protein
VLYDWGMKQEGHDSKKRIAFPILLPEGRAFAEKAGDLHVVPTGKWQHPAYGEMEITTADIKEFVQNFKDKVRRDIPITAGHDNGMNGGELPAIGWFREVYDRGVNGLWAYVEWTEDGAKLLQEGAYKYFSPEFYEEYEDPETRQVYHNVLVGGALTNKPYFKELEAPVLAFSEPGIMNQFNDPMDIKTVAVKKVEDLSADEKTFLREHKEQLSAEQQSAFKSVFDEAGGETDEQKAEREAKEAEDKAAAKQDEADKKAEEERQASEKNKSKVVTMSEAEVTALRKAADDGAKALQKIEASEREALAGKMVFSDTNKNGHFLPKEKEAVVKFLKTLSETQRDQFVNLIGKLPKRDASLFTEVGDGGAQEVSAEGIAKKVDGLVKAKMSEGKLSYSKALQQVFTEQPELKEQYEAALTNN